MTTSQMTTFNGIPVVIPNKTDDVDTGSPHWYVSYNYSTRDYGCDTTALVLGQGEYFIILDGDHRAAFNAVIASAADKGWAYSRLDLCLQYVRENKNLLNKMSNKVI